LPFSVKRDRISASYDYPSKFSKQNPFLAEFEITQNSLTDRTERGKGDSSRLSDRRGYPRPDKMKKMMQRSLFHVVLITMLILLLLNFLIQVTIAQRSMETNAKMLFWQIQQNMGYREQELQELKNEFTHRCLQLARNAAYVVQTEPEVLQNTQELQKIVKLLEIEELNIFNPKGVLYAGSNPKQFQRSLFSDQTMQMFQPMLTNHDLEMCQNIESCGGEAAGIWYAAVWREDEQGIVQIGVIPELNLEETQTQELTTILEQVASHQENDLLAIDPTTQTVLGATSPDMIGKTAQDLGVDLNRLSVPSTGFYCSIGEKMNYCFFWNTGSIILGAICPIKQLYQTVNYNTALMTVGLLLFASAVVWTVLRRWNKIVIQGMNAVNWKLQCITEGDIDEKVDVATTPEFSELSNRINIMVSTIRSSTDTMSSVLDLVHIPIGIYEYNKWMGRVRVTRRIPQLLGLSPEEEAFLLSNNDLFERRLESIRKHPVEGEEGVFQQIGAAEQYQYIRIESLIRDNGVVGVLMDVTKEIVEKRKLEQERDEDLLTGLCSRRAFYSTVAEMFEQPDKLQHAALIMVDADGLKMVNDNYGHDSGDAYLRQVGSAICAGVLAAPHRVVGRLGGDEFAVFLYGCQSHKEILSYVESLKKERESNFVTFGKAQIPVLFSIGCAYYPEEGDDHSKLLKSADQRMYEEKRHRKQERKN